VAISLSSSVQIAARIAGAREIAFGSYFVPGAMREALVAAARRGAHVEVTLEKAPYEDRTGSLARLNAASAAALHAAGAEVHLLSGDAPPYHIKAAVCDGVAYLDDRNWPAHGGTIVADDDVRDVALVREAIAGRGGADETLATRKDVAVQREAALIEGAGRVPVVVATESFGAGAISSALRHHAALGATTTLIVNRAHANRAVLAGLERAGVVVKNSVANEKLVLAGDAVWLGSANATYAGGEDGAQTDWGLVTRDPAFVAAVRERLSETTGSGSAQARRPSPGVDAGCAPA
jgi:phosphatidylserine/phosphatidylglycerophosphate/cardiolipin synthase-like enzyme